MVDYLIILINTLLKLHQSKNIKQNLLVWKNIIYIPYGMKMSLGQLYLKYIGPKIWSDIPENL